MNTFETIVASGPVIIENGKVLLNRHGDSKESQKYWKFVGGRVEADEIDESMEILEKVCKREAMEEMGLNIDIIMPLKPMLVKRPDEKGLVILIHFLAKRKNEIVPGEDIVEWKWFPLDQLPENCAPNIEPVIKDYLRLIDENLIEPEN